MVRNIVVIGGSSHPQLTERICSHLGIPPANVLLSKFSVGETRVEIQESVRGKDVYIIQSGAGKVNDHLMELLITISACKTASARKITAILPLFPYSRQSEVPHYKTGAPLTKASNCYNKPDFPYALQSASQTPHPDRDQSKGLTNGVGDLEKNMHKTTLESNANSYGSPTKQQPGSTGGGGGGSGTDLVNGVSSSPGSTASSPSHKPTRPSNLQTANGVAPQTNGNANGTHTGSGSTPPQTPKGGIFSPQPGYRQWVAQAGTLVADLLTCAGAEHIITMDLHDAQYQGFFDIPVDNLYGRPLLKNYVRYQVPDYKQAVIVSPDAGGAKRATAIADSLGMPFALIHKERRPTRITDRQNATMMLVGDVSNRTAILIDDLADTSNTITRAAKLLKKEGATFVYALITHGILSGDAIDRINASALDRLIVTNSVPQEEHQKKCPKLEVLDVGTVFAEAIRRVHHGESISVLFQYD
ncbi:ribose-phosphate pyrophosphokinase [Agyrium rufum]|nr:ribose-phosphate pyrophosphokinase [Agyrium rufum]